MKRRTTRWIFASVVTMWVVALWGLSVGAVENQVPEQPATCLSDGPDPVECPSPTETSASPSGTATGTSTGSPRTGSPTGTGSPSPTGTSTASPSPTGSSPSPSPTDTGPTTKSFNSSVTIKYRNGKFGGRVRSSSDRCEQRRTLVVKRKKRGRDATVGRSQTDQAGRWKLRFPRAEGRFYAKLKARSFTRNDTTFKCRGARSRTIRV